MGGWNKTQRIFHFVMIRPTHYDDDGYPIQWFLSLIPSNTLACMNGLAEDCRRRAVLGSDVDLRLHTFDETNQRVRPDRIIRAIQRNGNSGLIGLVGVQSNQIVRALDLALPFRRADLPVCIGGFHVSGCLAMLPNLPEELQRAQAMGVSLFAGEAEESLPQPAKAPLQFHAVAAELVVPTGADTAEEARSSDLQRCGKHRSRSRVSFPVYLLHYHQRTGSQEQIPDAG
jgi:hypothetical protein